MFTQDDAQVTVSSIPPTTPPAANQPLADQSVNQPVIQPTFSNPPAAKDPVAQTPPMTVSDDDQSASSATPTSDQFSTAPIAQSSANEPAEYVNSYTPPLEDESKTNQGFNQPVTDNNQSAAPVDSTQSVPKSSADALKELEELMQKLQQQTAANNQTNTPPAQPSTSEAPTSIDLSKIPPYGDQTETGEPAVDSEPPPSFEPASVLGQADASQKTTGVGAGEQPAQSQQSLAPDSELDMELPEAEETSEALVDQNVFFLLGVEDGSPEEQDRFLDELQQTVWNEFIENDLAQTVTAEQKAKVDEMMRNPSLDEIERQNQAIEYLDGIVPDFENLMMDKALKLKEDLVNERVASLRESLAQDPAKLAQLQQANELMTQNKWLSAGKILNQLG